jgi:biotin carboxyl carrier protein
MEEFIVKIDNKTFKVKFISDNSISIDDINYEFISKVGKGPIIDIKINTSTHQAYCQILNENEISVWLSRYMIKIEIEDDRTRLINSFKRNEAGIQEEIIIMSPMPGLVKKIEVVENEIVHPGNGLMILEAMKMENEIKSQIHGRVKQIKIKSNVSVEKNQPLIILEAIKQ